LFMVDMHSDMWLPSRDDPEMLAYAKKHKRVKYPDSSGGARDFTQSIANVDEQERSIAALLQIKYDEVLFGNTFFKNLGGGKFEEISDRAGLETFWPWGIATGDFDNDGYEDVFLPSGMGYPFYYWPNQLMMNTGKETFTDRAEELGIEPPPGGHFLPEKIGRRKAARSSRCAST